MPHDPRAVVLSERRIPPVEARTAGLTWTIAYEVPGHPGISQGAQLFRYYAGMDINLQRGSATHAIRVTATGDAAQLRRLLEWTDDLIRSKPALVEAFAAERFMQGYVTKAARPGRDIA